MLCSDIEKEFNWEIGERMDNDYKFRAYVTKCAPKSLQLHDVALNVFGTLLKSVDFTPQVRLA